DRRDVHDRAGALLHHRSADRAARVEDRGEVRLDHCTPVVVGHARQQAVACDAGVVDEDVEIACLLDELRRLFGTRDVGLDRSALDLACQRLRLLRPRAVADDDVRPGASELLGDRAADPLRGSGDESALALETCEAHASESSSGSRSSASMLFTETAFTLRSIRLTRPLSTLPGPTSTKVRAPSRMTSVADCVKRTGAVSWSTRSGPIRCADSTRAVTVDMKGATGCWKCTFSIAGRSRSAARATSGEWKAPETFS